MKNLIAYCELDCEKCDARIATVNNDNALREKTAKKWSELNNCPYITPDTINCMGCRTEGVKTVYCSQLCEIRKCAEGKGFNTCSECNKKESCAILAPILNNAPEAKNNLGCK